MAMDQDRINSWSNSDRLFSDITGSNVFTTSDNTKYVTVNTWQDVSYITNNYDPIKAFDGASVSNLQPTVNGSGDTLDRTLILYDYKHRLVALRPYIAGALQPQRAQWSKIGAPNDWSNNGYVDAPTLDWIVSAGFLGNRLLVCFERSIWALDYTGDEDLPFVWEKLISTEGSSAPLSLVPFANELLFLGPTRLTATDGMSTEVVNTPIPEIVTQFDSDAYSTTYGAVLEEMDEVIWNYPEIGSSYPNRNLIYNYRNGAWSMWDMPIQVIGYYRQVLGRTWDNTQLTWDEATFTWDAKELQAGYPTILGGCRDGTVHTIDRTGTDKDARAIPFKMTTGELNPFVEKGRQARLGALDIFHDIHPDTTITVNLYLANATEPYYSTSIALDGPSSQTRTWSRILVNASADGHQIEIEHNEKHQTVVIHALAPWFKPAGGLIYAA